MLVGTRILLTTLVYCHLWWQRSKQQEEQEEQTTTLVETTLVETTLVELTTRPTGPEKDGMMMSCWYDDLTSYRTEEGIMMMDCWYEL
jgi:hypothetical protein